MGLVYFRSQRHWYVWGTEVQAWVRVTFGKVGVLVGSVQGHLWFSQARLDDITRSTRLDSYQCQ